MQLLPRANIDYKSHCGRRRALRAEEWIGRWYPKDIERAYITFREISRYSHGKPWRITMGSFCWFTALRFVTSDVFVLYRLEALKLFIRALLGNVHYEILADVCVEGVDFEHDWPASLRVRGTVLERCPSIHMMCEATGVVDPTAWKPMRPITTIRTHVVSLQLEMVEIDFATDIRLGTELKTLTLTRVKFLKDCSIYNVVEVDMTIVTNKPKTADSSEPMSLVQFPDARRFTVKIKQGTSAHVTLPDTRMGIELESHYQDLLKRKRYQLYAEFTVDHDEILSIPFTRMHALVSYMAPNATDVKVIGGPCAVPSTVRKLKISFLSFFDGNFPAALVDLDCYVLVSPAVTLKTYVVHISSLCPNLKRVTLRIPKDEGSLKTYCTAESIALFFSSKTFPRATHLQLKHSNVFRVGSEFSYAWTKHRVIREAKYTIITTNINAMFDCGRCRHRRGEISSGGDIYIPIGPRSGFAACDDDTSDFSNIIISVPENTNMYTSTYTIRDHPNSLHVLTKLIQTKWIKPVRHIIEPYFTSVSPIVTCVKCSTHCPGYVKSQ